MSAERKAPMPERLFAWTDELPYGPVGYWHHCAGSVESHEHEYILASAVEARVAEAAAGERARIVACFREKQRAAKERSVSLSNAGLGSTLEYILAIDAFMLSKAVADAVESGEDEA